MTKIRATFPDGHVAERRTEAVYTHAARKDGRVSFHASADAARSTRGAGAEIIAVDGVRGSSCIVCDGSGVVRYGPSAVDGSYSTVVCHRCGGSGHVVR